MTAIDPGDLEALYAEAAARRANAWAKRHTNRRNQRAQHQQARNAGLQARHNRKLARKEDHREP